LNENAKSEFRGSKSEFRGPMTPLAKLFALSAVTFAGALLPAHANVLVQVDKSDQRMTVSVDGVRRYSWPVSTGGAGYDTPSGTFRPNRMDADHFSKEYGNAPMPHAIFFDLHGHAIHGSFETVGRPVSHGCVRVSPAHAAKLFSLVQSEGMGKTTVEIEGDAPTITARRRRVGHGRRVELGRRVARLDDRAGDARPARNYPSAETYGYSSSDGRYASGLPYAYDQGPRGASYGYDQGHALVYREGPYGSGFRWR